MAEGQLILDTPGDPASDEATATLTVSRAATH